MINESILNNCPVIISDKTPWQDLEFNNLGYVCDVTKYQEFQKKIKFFLEMDQNQYDNYVNDMYGNVSKVINTKISFQNISIYLRLKVKKVMIGFQSLFNWYPFITPFLTFLYCSYYVLILF